MERDPAVEDLAPAAPVLARPRILRQDWRDLTFVHWAVEPAAVERFMPPGVRPDRHEGRTYVGLIPFRMVDAGFAHGPAVPYVGTFLETNVRLYSVDSTGRRGIVFLSLDADRLAVVAGARAVFGLPYRWARMRHRSRALTDGGVQHEYRTRLRGRRVSPVTSVVTVRAHETVGPTSLDVFLTARWGLHVRHLGRTWYVPNQHRTWDLRRAEVDLDDGLVGAAGLPGLTDRPPDHVAFSDGVHTEFGPPGPATRPRAVPVTG